MSKFLGASLLCAAMLAGCKTPQPNLVPAKTTEQFNAPPMGGRYDTPGYPKEAEDNKDAPTRAVISSTYSPPRTGLPNSVITNGVR